MQKLILLLRRARRLHETEGTAHLAKRALAFLVGLVFEYRVYYVYADRVSEVLGLGESEVMPKVGDLTIAVVCTNREADDLEALGLEFRSYVRNFDARKALDRGATAICIFAGSVLATIGWVALSPGAKDSLGEPPYRVDFSNGEACSAGLWTHPRYRRQGLRAYGRLKRLEFLQRRGVHTRWGAILRGNTVAREGRAWFQPEPRAQARYLRILWWKWWQERPLTSGEASE